uniref:JAB1/MPN/MOV34 metalloenzyme domain-containing protein n=1 Tax=Leersia perrieri TaxID=77586 RepID=A0A0D9WTV4_9ORYZ
MDPSMLNMMMAAAAGGDRPQPDSSEQIYVSPLALLEMLKHEQARVPMKVMELMLGEFVDKYTMTVTDMLAMPRSGTSISVKTVDHAFQSDMLEMLQQMG